jgi:hypothetical protein
LLDIIRVFQRDGQGYTEHTEEKKNTYKTSVENMIGMGRHHMGGVGIDWWMILQ